MPEFGQQQMYCTTRIDIEQEAHLRSRPIKDSLTSQQMVSVQERSTQVFSFEFRVIFQDLLFACTLCQKLQDHIH